MMKITVYFNKTIGSLVNKTDKAQSLKNREGCKPANLAGVITFEAPDKINLAWKKSVEKSLSIIPGGNSVQRIVVVKGENTYPLDCESNNPKTVSNVLGNYLLRIEKPIRFDNMNKSFLIKK